MLPSLILGLLLVAHPGAETSRKSSFGVPSLPSAEATRAATPAGDVVRIQLARASQQERQAARTLQKVIARYDLTPWTFSRQVIVDEDSQPREHPVLTLDTRHSGEDLRLLSSYLGKQIELFLSSQDSLTGQAVAALRQRYPRGPQDAAAYRGLLVCALEAQALETVLGVATARELLASEAKGGDGWVYRTVSAERAFFDAFLEERGLGMVH